jgi:hypothetical protein
MALSAELKKLLDDLKARADRGEVVAALRDNADYADLRNDIFQPIYNEGVQATEATHKSAKTSLQNQITALETERDKAKADLKKLKDENPDQASLHKQYGDQIAAKDREIADLKAQHTTEKKDTKRKAMRDTLEKELLALRVDPHKAAAAADASERQMLVDDNIAGRVLQPGLSIAFAGDEAAQIKALANEIFKTVPKALILSSVQGGGSGGEGDTTGDNPGNTGNTKKDALERAKQAALNKYKRPDGSGNDRVLSGDEQLDKALGVMRR